MPSSKYSSAETEKAARVQALFSSIARKYDLINDIQSLGMHRLWKRRVVAMADVGEGDCAVDLCCGSGDITEFMARTGADTTGLDFNQSMLDVAKKRLSGRDHLKVKYVHGDALAVSVEDGTFDAATMGYGLRNLANFEAGIAEIVRIVRPGGRIVILDFGKPESATLRKLYFAYLRYIVPLLGAVTCGDKDAYAYILDSLQQYPGQRAVDSELENLGCKNRNIVSLLGGTMSINFAIRP